MPVTAAPCAIKGTAFDCLRDVIERRGYTGKEENRSEEKVLPLACVRRPSAPDLGINLLRYGVSSYPALKVRSLSPALIRLYPLVRLCPYVYTGLFYLIYLLSLCLRMCL